MPFIIRINLTSAFWRFNLRNDSDINGDNELLIAADRINMADYMKTKLCLLLFMAFLCFPVLQLSGQDKADISLGIGFTEQINIGCKFQILDQAKIGFNLGWFPENQTNGWLLSLQGNFYYHLFGTSELSDVHPWYARVGLNYLRDDYWGAGGVNWWYSHLRFGRGFYFSEKTGMSLDAGLYYHLNSEVTGNRTFGPSMGICFFYRLH